MPLVIRILYTEEFLPVVGFAIIMLASVGFKIIEWCIGFSLIARGRTNVFFVNEVSFKIYLLIFSLLFFNQWGLVGVGIAYFISELLFSVQSVILIRKLYKFTFQNSSLSIIIVSIILVLLTLSFNRSEEHTSELQSP